MFFVNRSLYILFMPRNIVLLRSISEIAYVSRRDNTSCF